MPSLNCLGSLMPSIRKLMLVVLLPLVLALMPGAARAEKRIALVVGNAAYQAGALVTPANDAGLIAQTLQAAGFDVVGARDLDQDSLRRALREPRPPGRIRSRSSTPAVTGYSSRARITSFRSTPRSRATAMSRQRRCDCPIICGRWLR